MKNLVLSILALVAISFAQPAFAFGDVNCNGNHACEADNSSTDSHDVSATGGAGGQGGAGGLGGSATTGASTSEVDDSGNSAVGNGHGNFSPDATAVQGQQQGQIGIVAPEIETESSVKNSGNSDVDTTDVNVNGQSQSGVNKQGQAQAQNSDDDFVIEGDTYEAARIPVNSAAPVFAGACSQGVSAQMPTFGASAGTGNPVCDYVAIAGAFVASGERAEALRVLAKAEEAADSRTLRSEIRGWLTLGLL